MSYLDWCIVEEKDCVTLTSCVLMGTSTLCWPQITPVINHLNYKIISLHNQWFSL